MWPAPTLGTTEALQPVKRNLPSGFVLKDRNAVPDLAGNR